MAFLRCCPEQPTDPPSSPSLPSPSPLILYLLFLIPHPLSPVLSSPLLFCISFFQMDPVQKAVMSHTFGPPLIKTKRPIISCNVCQIRFNSEVQTQLSHHLIQPTFSSGPAVAVQGCTSGSFQVLLATGQLTDLTE